MAEKNKKENRVKLYGVIIGVATAFLQHGVYLLANDAAHLVGVTPFLPKIPFLDDAIPFWPVFIIPYVWAYLFWAMAPMAASKCKLDHFLDYLAAYVFACLFGGLILTFAPTYMDRVAEGLYNPAQQGFFYRFVRFWYSLDGSEMAYNLFPSFHCINSSVSYLAVARREEVPKWFRVYSLITMLLIFISTLFVKQHFVVDVISGAVIAFAVFSLCKKWRAGRIFMPAVRLIQKIFAKRKTEADL